MSQTQTSMVNRISSYVRNHEASLGTLLAAYGAFYLASVIMGGWTLSDGGKDVFPFPQSAVQAVMPRSAISPIFFITSLPTLLIGMALLCNYSIRALRSGLTVDSEHVAVLLAAFGFTYSIVGAWPLQLAVDLPWEWQKQIVSYGPVFAWMLYLLGIVALAVGGVSLYAHSRDYHRRHPELSMNLQ